MSDMSAEFLDKWHKESESITFFGVRLCVMERGDLLAIAAYLAEKVVGREDRPRPPLLRRRPEKPATSFVITVTGGEQ